MGHCGGRVIFERPGSPPCPPTNISSACVWKISALTPCARLKVCRNGASVHPGPAAVVHALWK
eukprot:4417119-Lingulodinium_polyedra.AAC.1